MHMKVLIPIVVLAAGVAHAAPIDGTFNYQGRLTSGGAPITGNADVRFSLWDAAAAGSQVGGTINYLSAPVTDGLFNADLDFGVSSLNGDMRWLQIEVRSPSGVGSYVDLGRQQILGTPYAVQTRGIFVSDDLNVTIGTSGTGKGLTVQDGDSSVLVLGSSGSDGAGYLSMAEAADFRKLTVELDADYDDLADGVTQGGLTLRGFGGSSGGRVSIRNDSGVETVRVLGGTSGNGSFITLGNGAVTTVNIQSDSFDGGLLTVGNADGNHRIDLDGDSAGGGAGVFYAGDGSTTVVLSGESENSGGLVAVRNDTSEETVQILGDNGDDSGFVALRDRSSTRNVDGIVLDARDFAGTGSHIDMYDNSGQQTVEIDSSDGGTGQIRLLQSDGSVSFQVFGNTLYVYNDAGSPTISLAGNGAKNAIVPTRDYGQRLMNCVESTGVWFDDYGSAQLVNGAVRVDLDPMFLQTVTIDASHPMKVLVTPTAQCNGVYVTKGLDHFIVRELASGTSSATFDYRVVAVRAGFENTRMEAFVPPELRPDSDATRDAVNPAPRITHDGVEGVEIERRPARRAPAPNNANDIVLDHSDMQSR